MRIGSLGTKHFAKGIYAYIGSAQKNFEKRIMRHLRMDKQKFWHIDHLLSDENVKIINVFLKEATRIGECEFAAKLGEMNFPVNRFGSSDCKCKSHLFRINDYELLRRLLYENNFKEASVMREGWCVWITGLPGSGKSVVSKALVDMLREKGIHVQLLSSDALRKVMTPKPKYTLEERDIVYATLVYVAKLLTQNGVNVVIDATGNFRRYRENARAQITKFMEAYLKCPLETCIQREAKRIETHLAPRKIYDKAQRGMAPTVPGMGQPYEEPLNPEVKVDTERLSPEKCAEKIMKIIVGRYH